MRFNEVFRELVSQRGVMARLSEETGISAGLLSNYKKDIDPSLTNATKIARFFNISLDYMVGLKDTPEIEGHSPAHVMEIETVRLVEDFESLPEEGRGAILDQVEFQKMKSLRASETSLPDNPLPGIA